MKNNLFKTVSFLIAILLIMTSVKLNVFAATNDILTINAEGATDGVTVFGTTGSDVVAVVVEIFDSTNELVTMETYAVTSAAYSAEIEATLTAGSTYIAYVVNYDGSGESLETEFTVPEESTSSSTTEEDDEDTDEDEVTQTITNSDGSSITFEGLDEDGYYTFTITDLTDPSDEVLAAMGLTAEEFEALVESAKTLVSDAGIYVGLFDMSLMFTATDGTEIDLSDERPFTVVIPVSDELATILAAYNTFKFVCLDMDANGNLVLGESTYVTATYDSTNKTLTATFPHFSVWALTVSNVTQPEEGDASSTGLMIALLVISLMAAVCSKKIKTRESET